MATTGAQQRTQKGQSVIHMTEEQAREYVEQLHWPDGKPTCRHCGSVNAYRMQGKSCRPGLCRCRDCKKQFTVTVGTIFEDSHLPLSTWVKAIHLMCSSKKGISALQLQRNLGLGSYNTAWFMAHRIRLAMKCEPMAGMLTHEVQVDETYVGGKPRKGSSRKKYSTKKVPVLAAVESAEGGKAICQPVEHVDSKTLCEFIKPNIHKVSIIVTDELALYRKAAQYHVDHQTVNHSISEYVNAGGYTTNTAESFFALLKRGVYGTFHHVSAGHLHRYCDEFSFRWNGRTVSDAQRREQAIQQVEGKRLMFKQPKA